MSPSRSSSCRRQRDSQRGAVAVEGAIVITFILVPLLLGVLVYGQYFWRAQHVGAYLDRTPIDGISGRFASCGELVERIRTTAVSALGTNLSNDPIAAESLTIEVVQLLPTVGAVVNIGVRAEGVVGALSDLLPIPGAGSLLGEITVRLDNVVVSTNTCP